MSTPLPSSFTQTFELIGDSYKKEIEEKIKQSLEDFGAKTELRNACQYALMSGGKRFRPAIVFMVAEALGFGFNVSDAALAVEYFHCASLIADDLPCMDNDDTRREKPSLHKVYGEAIALLTTYALIAAGYERLQRNTATLIQNHALEESISNRICVLALANTTHNTGILGATGGQFLDLFPPQSSVDMALQTIRCKTISLFEISFVLGWLYGGGEPSLLDKVKQLAYHFGLAFQVADDLHDLKQDAQNNRTMNMAILVGKEESLALVKEEMNHYFQLLSQLKLDVPSMQGLGSLVLNQIHDV